MLPCCGHARGSGRPSRPENRSMELLRPMPATSLTRLPKPAAASTEMPIAAPSVPSMRSPATSMMALSKKPKPMKGTPLRRATWTSWRLEGRGTAAAAPPALAPTERSNRLRLEATQPLNSAGDAPGAREAAASTSRRCGAVAMPFGLHSSSTQNPCYKPQLWSRSRMGRAVCAPGSEIWPSALASAAAKARCAVSGPILESAAPCMASTPVGLSDCASFINSAGSRSAAAANLTTPSLDAPSAPA